MDHAKASLKVIFESGRYEKIPDVILFDAHEEYDHEDALVRRFDKNKLQDICDECNRRADETGDLSPGGPGHTISGAAEEDQPPIWSYFHKFRVSTYGKQKKPVIIADEWVEKKVLTKHHGEMDWEKALSQYPRRSVEYWCKDGYFDWIAHLKRTPQRDLGLMVFSKESNATRPVQATEQYFAEPGQRKQLAARCRGGKLYYSMEQDMALTPPAGANLSGNDDDDFRGRFMKCAKEAYPRLDEMHGRYHDENPQEDPEGDPNAPPVDDLNSDPPPVDGDPQGDPMQDDNLEKFAKTAQGGDAVLAAELRRERKRNDALQARLKALETDTKTEKLNFSKQDAANRVAALIDDGYVLDSAREIEDFEKTPIDKRGERVDYIRQHYKQDADVAGVPTGNRPLSTATEPRRGGKRNFSKADADNVQKIMARDGISYDAAMEKYTAK